MGPTLPTLLSLKPGDTATVFALDVGSELAHRLAALGLRAGRTLRVLRRARFAGPFHIRVGTTDVMLRAREAQAILVRPLVA